MENAKRTVLRESVLSKCLQVCEGSDPKREFPRDIYRYQTRNPPAKGDALLNYLEHTEEVSLSGSSPARFVEIISGCPPTVHKSIHVHIGGYGKTDNSKTPNILIAGNGLQGWRLQPVGGHR